ncbi:hypothetical protein K6119_11895 [Paracrocinitomix mangrovi]|uniref:hypothetical protein n=1 Tax=Paracrocinitomix mangrovi TaxID=2862509 RepID=UPI001C8E5D3F|nr:hypothetical protein [Paracrocinitomix mangrovi]UKN00434.1 hypothetical protein K6119_11895 [Paracrocinitomix mangrovi]
MSAGFVYGQGDHDGNRLYDHDLDESKWEDIRNDIRYEGSENGAGRPWTYENRRDYERARSERGGNGGSGSGGGNGNGSGSGSNGGSYSSSPSSPSAAGAGGLSVLGYVLLGVFIVGLAFLIFYLFINAPKDGKKVDSEYDLDEINPTEIPLTELQRLLGEALSKGDYRGAVRIYFIFIIRDLASKNWIQWEKEKTNFHYLREMANRPEYDGFNKTVSYFEIIWYGERELDENLFRQIQPNFTQMLDKLGVE